MTLALKATARDFTLTHFVAQLDSDAVTQFLDAARAMRLSWGARLRHVVVPGALPSALVGLRGERRDAGGQRRATAEQQDARDELTGDGLRAPAEQHVARHAARAQGTPLGEEAEERRAAFGYNRFPQHGAGCRGR